jgi:perosamine synthetase
MAGARGRPRYREIVIERVKERIDAVSVPADGTIRDAMRAIDRGALGLAVLVEPDTGVFAGLVTDGDIRRALLRGSGLDTPVADTPRPEPKVARVGMSMDAIAALFSGPVRVVPLLDEADRVTDLAVFDTRARLPVAAPSLGERELLYVAECVLTGWVSSGGAFVTRFEQMFAEFCGTRHALAASNGTAALHLALLALGVGPGDEVIVPSFTFVATANAVTYTGASPVFVDSDRETWTIDPALAAEAVTARTKAIVPVHVYGHPADMDPIMELAARHGLAVVEDAAEAHGARYKGRPVGGIGDIGIFSFYGNKIVTTGEGGMVVTDDDELADKVRLMRGHGMSPDRRYWHPVLGYNYRLTNLQAALGVAQMERVDEILASKRRIAETYGEHLGGLPGLRLPAEAPWASSVHWLYSVLIDEEAFGMSRDRVMDALSSEAETRPLFPPLHRQPIYDRGERLPVAEQLAATGLSLPSAPGLPPEEVRRVASLLADLSKTAPPPPVRVS